MSGDLVNFIIHTTQKLPNVSDYPQSSDGKFSQENRFFRPEYHSKHFHQVLKQNMISFKLDTHILVTQYQLDTLTYPQILSPTFQESPNFGGLRSLFKAFLPSSNAKYDLFKLQLLIIHFFQKFFYV